jgi:3-oxoadipate enol-lactonase
MPQVLNYQTYGQPQETALLLVHPLGTDLRFWEECVDIWKSRFHCIAPDLQAAGKSPRPEVPVTIPGHAADLERLRDSLGVKRVVPIGCALGGMIAATYAARYPQHSLALVMANPGLGSTDAAKEMLRKRVETLRSSGVVALLPAAADRAFMNLPHDERYQRHVERFAAQDPETFARSVLGFVDADITGDLPRIKCPALIVSGEHDVLMPSDSAQHIKEMVPQAQCTVMRGVAHFLPFQAPDRFAPMVADFLGSVLAVKAPRP